MPQPLSVTADGQEVGYTDDARACNRRHQSDVPGTPPEASYDADVRRGIGVRFLPS